MLVRLTKMDGEAVWVNPAAVSTLEPANTHSEPTCTLNIIGDPEHSLWLKGTAAEIAASLNAPDSAE